MGDFKAGVPARGLRVVMLTPDVLIDRRIINEAGTLIENGWDAYILAAPLDRRGRFEHEGPVPVERVDPVRYGTFVERLGLRAQRKPPLRSLATAGLRVSRLAQRTAGRVIDRIEQATPSRRSPLVRTLQLSSYELSFLRCALFYRPDVVHVHDLPMLRVGAAVRAATGARLVYDMHEFYPEQAVLPRGARRRLRSVERAHIGDADARITVNPHLARAIGEAYGVDVGVVQNAAVEPMGLHEARDDRLRRELGISANDAVLLYQGGLARHRNLEHLIDAMSLVERSVVLVLMGYYEPGYRDALVARARAGSAAERVSFVDAKPQDQLLAYTASADVGLLPYPRDVDVNTRLASPNKLYEFIAARLPILANDLSFVREVVEPNGFGVVADLETPASIAHAIDSFPYEDLESFRANLAERGARWTWQEEQAALLEIYEDLARS